MHHDADTLAPGRLLHAFLRSFLAACAALVAIAAVHYHSIYRSERVGRETAERVGLELLRRVMVADTSSRDRSGAPSSP